MRRLAGSAAIAAVLLAAAGCSTAGGGASDPARESEQPQALTRLVAVEAADVGSFRIGDSATVESDADFQSTTLTLNITKLSNAVENSLGVRVAFGEVTCESRRPFIVANAEASGGKLFAGDQGFHELRCQPFTVADDFADLPPGEVSELW